MTRLFRTAAFVLLLLPVSVVAQEDARASGDSLRMAGDLRGAILAYYDVLAQGGNAAYALASTYAFAPLPTYADSAFKYLRIALPREDSMQPLYDPDLYYLSDDERWAQVEATQLDKLANQVAGTFDRDYARQLLHIRMNEWAFRYHITLAHRTLGPDSPVVTALAKVMGEHHNANEAHLLSLVEEKGWPTLSAVGEEAAYAAGNVINHSGLAVRQKYLPFLEAACESGEADWSRYAHILDRTELELGNPQVYGTQMEMDEERGRFVPQPIVDPERVDERRAAKGMEPIADQLRRFNESMARDFGSAAD